VLPIVRGIGHARSGCRFLLPASGTPVRRSFRQFAKIEFDVAASHRCLSELLGNAPSFDVVTGQLIDAVQERRHGDTRIGREHVRLQVRAQRVGRVRFERAGRNHVTSPGQHGRGNQQRFVRNAFMFDDERLAVRFRHVGECAVSIWMILLQMIERGVQRSLVGVADDLGQQRIELRFPEAVFGAAARREKRERKTDKLVGIGGETFGDSRAHKSGSWGAQNLIF
jgi:hypothetical protein